jgi:hypothetical protein
VLPALKSIGFARLALVLIVALLGTYLSFAFAVAGVTRNKNPAITLRFIPWEGVALAKQADLLFLANVKDPPEFVTELAKKSLHWQALNPAALRLLGYTYPQTGEEGEKARRFIELSAQLSRREAGAQLWLIQRAATYGELPQALSHIDILLKTRPSSSSTLFPILLQGLPDPGFRKLFRGYMRRPSPWVGSFLSYGVANTADLQSMVKLITEAKGFPDYDTSPAQARRLMSRLDKAGQYEALTKIYMLMPGAKPTRLQNPEFDKNDVDEQFGVVGWQSFDGPDAGAAVISEKGAPRPQLTLYASASTTRRVASRLLILDPGLYTLSTTIEEADYDRGASMSWQLRCPSRAAGGLPWSGKLAGAQSSMVIVIPSDCPVQFLDLIASGGQGRVGLEATISNVKLSPFGRTR